MTVMISVGKGAVMEKRLCIASMVVAGILFLAFVADVFLHIPFGGGSTFLIIDIIGALAGALLMYLSWNALRDVL